MSLSKILSISGKPGLYSLVGQMKNGIIVESVEDGKRFPIHGADKVSALEEISIYTTDEDMPLKDVFARIYEKEGGKKCIGHKEDKEKVKAYFESVLPEYDAERVYISDMVKVVKWYNMLIEKNLYSPEQEAEEENEGSEGEASEGENEEAKAKKAAPKKAAKKPVANKAQPKSTGKTSGAKATGGKTMPRKAS